MLTCDLHANRHGLWETDIKNTLGTATDMADNIIQQASKILESVIDDWRADGAAALLTRKQFLWGAGVIVVLAAILRFWNLDGAPIDMDEGATRAFAQLPLGMILFDNIDVHPPLTYAIQHVWQSVFPDPSVMRVPAAVFGILSVGLTLLVVKTHASARAALISAGLLAVATAHVYYSQDARQYPILMSALMLAMYGALDISGSKWRIAAYVIGGVAAIYTHAIGLIAMGLIGFSSLAGGYLTEKNKVFKPWLIANLIILPLVLPWLISAVSAAASFKGLGDTTPIIEIQWFHRNAIGFAGLGGISIIFEAALVLLSFFGGVMAFYDKKYQLSFTILSLCFVYPVLLAILHLQSPILATRVLLPSLLGTVIGIGYLCANLRFNWQVGIAGAVFALSAASTFNELGHRIKSEQNRQALEFVNAEAAANVPVITCNIWTMASVWETQPGVNLYNLAFDDIPSSPDKPLVHYRSPDYWKTLELGALGQQRMTPEDKRDFLGPEWMVMGGTLELLAGENEVAVLRSFCQQHHIDAIETALAESGFALHTEADYRQEAEGTLIFHPPNTVVRIYRKQS